MTHLTSSNLMTHLCPSFAVSTLSPRRPLLKWGGLPGMPVPFFLAAETSLILPDFLWGRVNSPSLGDMTRKVPILLASL